MQVARVQKHMHMFRRGLHNSDKARNDLKKKWHIHPTFIWVTHTVRNTGLISTLSGSHQVKIWTFVRSSYSSSSSARAHTHTHTNTHTNTHTHTHTHTYIYIYIHTHTQTHIPTMPLIIYGVHITIKHIKLKLRKINCKQIEILFNIQSHLQDTSLQISGLLWTLTYFAFCKRLAVFD
jgi:hypothetical protein